MSLRSRARARSRSGGMGIMMGITSANCVSVACVLISCPRSWSSPARVELAPHRHTVAWPVRGGHRAGAGSRAIQSTGEIGCSLLGVRQGLARWWQGGGKVASDEGKIESVSVPRSGARKSYAKNQVSSSAGCRLWFCPRAQGTGGALAPRRFAWQERGWMLTSNGRASAPRIGAKA